MFKLHKLTVIYKQNLSELKKKKVRNTHRRQLAQANQKKCGIE